MKVAISPGPGPCLTYNAGPRPVLITDSALVVVNTVSANTALPKTVKVLVTTKSPLTTPPLMARYKLLASYVVTQLPLVFDIEL